MMNARELIEALSLLDPETPIRYAYQDDFRDWPTEIDIESVSFHGWLNEDEDDQDVDESGVSFGSVPLTVQRVDFLGNPQPEWNERPVLENVIRENLRKVYPRFESVGFDGSLYWKSLEEYTTGDIIEHRGKEYRVKYGWHWYSQGPVPLYMAELEPADFDRSAYVPGSDSRMKDAS